MCIYPTLQLKAYKGCPLVMYSMHRMEKIVQMALLSFCIDQFMAEPIDIWSLIITQNYPEF